MKTFVVQHDISSTLRRSFLEMYLHKFSRLNELLKLVAHKIYNRKKENVFLIARAEIRVYLKAKWLSFLLLQFTLKRQAYRALQTSVKGSRE